MPRDRATPLLVPPTIDRSTTAVALLLHGGREVSTAPVRPWNTAALRMRPFAGAIRRLAPDVAVARLRYRHRGWNGSAADPLADVAWALGAIRSLAGERPVVLVGHSLGGRAAIGSAGNPLVTGVVGLAPWLPRREPVDQLTGTDVVLLHGTRDRTTDPLTTATFAERAATVARDVVSLRLTGTGHTMVSRAATWHELTARFVAAIAAGAPIASVEPEHDGVHSTRIGVA